MLDTQRAAAVFSASRRASAADSVTVGPHSREARSAASRRSFSAASAACLSRYTRRSIAGIHTFLPDSGTYHCLPSMAQKCPLGMCRKHCRLRLHTYASESVASHSPPEGSSLPLISSTMRSAIGGAAGNVRGWRGGSLMLPSASSSSPSETLAARLPRRAGAFFFCVRVRRSALRLASSRSGSSPWASRTCWPENGGGIGGSACGIASRRTGGGHSSVASRVSSRLSCMRFCTAAERAASSVRYCRRSAGTLPFLRRIGTAGTCEMAVYW
mmetsp:Transcript_11944/g.37173  ORF Transcript_11944/g.37173 Transcript_11944/m.37173 type:complete len:271 (+) Transcript_11944:609-1421(+)